MDPRIQEEEKLDKFMKMTTRIRMEKVHKIRWQK